MFTDCPSCESQFRVRAAQLGAADGWVRCGNCGETFYALERLSDTPVNQLPTLRQTGEPAPVLPEQVTAPIPHVEIAETAGTETTDTDEKREQVPDLPPVLAGDPGKKTGSPARLVWGSLVAVLSLTAVAQLAWFNRDGLLRAYPALVPWAEQLCESLQCEPIRFRDVSAIELLNRQVTQHPRVRNALLASGSMVNGAEFIQPFPDIVLLIFSTDGQVISRGRFKPAQYLGPGVNPSGGMPPGVPVHFGLQLSGASREAVSFHFRFH